VAVATFLEGRFPFPAIARVIDEAMTAYESGGVTPVRDLDDVRAIDRWAREFAARSAGGVQSKV
jgi:1-deoxy-D-xylulose-5-phosphate reductoisomerase